MKNYLLVIALMLSSLTYAQEAKKTKAREFYEKSDQTRIKKDYNNTAKFVTGHGETLTFTPVEIIDLKTEEVVKALQVDMVVEGREIQTAWGKSNEDLVSFVWVDYEEVDGFINFLETFIIPNISKRQAAKTFEKYTFRSGELTMTYSFDTSESTSTKPSLRFEVSFNRLDDIKASDYTTYINYTFWTKRKAKNIPKVLTVLKSIRDNK